MEHEATGIMFVDSRDASILFEKYDCWCILAFAVGEKSYSNFHLIIFLRYKDNEVRLSLHFVRRYTDEQNMFYTFVEGLCPLINFGSVDFPNESCKIYLLKSKLQYFSKQESTATELWDIIIRNCHPSNSLDRKPLASRKLVKTRMVGGNLIVFSDRDGLRYMLPLSKVTVNTQWIKIKRTICDMSSCFKLSDIPFAECKESEIILENIDIYGIVAVIETLEENPRKYSLVLIPRLEQPPQLFFMRTVADSVCPKLPDTPLRQIDIGEFTTEGWTVPYRLFLTAFTVIEKPNICTQEERARCDFIEWLLDRNRSREYWYMANHRY